MSKENIERFEELAGRIERDGMDKLMEYIRNSDFYTAPASQWRNIQLSLHCMRQTWKHQN